MTYIAKPKFHHPALKKNAVGLLIATMRGASPRSAPGAGTTRFRPR